MHTFALEKIKSVKGKQSFFKLIKHNKCYFDDFEADIKQTGNYQSELISLYVFMEYLAEGQSLPKTKFRDITPKKEVVKEYELKTKHLRLYLIKQQNGKVVVLGGQKNEQKKDLHQFRAIKKQFLEEIKQKKQVNII